MQWNRDAYTVTCDPARQDRRVIAEFLATTYWAKDIPPSVVEKALDGSLCFSLLHGENQAGFARVVSDRATFAYLADVFVLPEHRGKGLAEWLIGCVVSHPELQGFRRWMLATRDAHRLYARFGFTPLKRPEIFMERHDPEVYSRLASADRSRDR
ncbi:MAG TPA: GNAT family N-acetyltransferase [Gammaproteobacteria bacterium]|nr:GNAT family N-acetyltransferase [Gammaproteobacteria bacterium]